MANRKKVKEETTSKSKPANVTSNIEENKEENSQVKVPTMEDYENSEKNSEAVEKAKEEIQTLEEILEKVTQPSESQEETSDNGKTTENPEPENIKPKLHVLADDRLNSLINRANELGITDVIQILNSDKFGQFYLVYKD